MAYLVQVHRQSTAVSLGTVWAGRDTETRGRPNELFIHVPYSTAIARRKETPLSLSVSLSLSHPLSLSFSVYVSLSSCPDSPKVMQRLDWFSLTALRVPTRRAADKATWACT